ncbi:uncharacterized protein [Nicotiana tomentosiformis]|uniref:uncharacterized protein n=1 Tax=Nicotiana tomentosiformis TaxID=4098 RepID=UPI00388C37BF
MELVHIDLCGPIRILSRGGKRYVMVLIDDYSRFTWTLFLTYKDEAFDMFTSFVRKTQKQLGNQHTSIRYDHGTEFENAKFAEFCDEHGIDHNFSAPRTPQQNGVVERNNMTLEYMARAMLLSSKLPHSFWAEAEHDDEAIGLVIKNLNETTAQTEAAHKEGTYDGTMEQMPRAWYERLSKLLLEHDYKRGKIDNTLFLKEKGKDLLAVQIYVDDIIFGATTDKLSKEFAKLMGSEFEISMMSELNLFLGLQIKQSSNGIKIHQQNYVKEFLKRF